MKIASLVLVAVLLSVCSCANWAVLVAGSNSWYNYRHQADVFHAYQMLVQKGFDKSKIIVLAFDDIANNRANPFPGKVFNKPTYNEPGLDVYEGVQIDYKGADVTPAVFLAVLEGNKAANVGKGTGRVLESTADDNVMIFFSDHGAPNLIAFPTSYLYADALLATFAKMQGQYQKVVFYLESCESGSMFVHLPTDTKIYAVSAANPTESSWGTYCSPDDVIQGKHIGSCLGDLFACKFVQDSESMDLTAETLQTQFQKIRAQTTLSHVLQYGDISFVSEPASNFMGSGNSAKNTINLRQPLRNYLFGEKKSVNFDSRLMKIKILTENFKRLGTEAAMMEMREEMMDMQRHDNIFHHVQQDLKLSGQYSPRHMNYTCMRAVMDNHTEQCGRLSDYGLMYAKFYAEACERVSAEEIISKVRC